MPIRSPIIVVVGHVDHGKSTLLDKIRQTTVQKAEAGGITQCIGATEIPVSKIEEISGNLLKKMNIQLSIPGLLAIDTPGHEAFTNLRKRGGSIADLAILVIDITQGVQPQTIESIEILKQFKVPFVIAANKVDLIHGWRPQKTLSYSESIKFQNDYVKEFIQNKIYDLMRKFSIHNINCDLFNNIDDFTQSVSIVPCSGITGEGISELLVMISGLAEKFLKDRLEIKSKNAKGSVLEVKKTIGLGTTIDVIIYDGMLKKNHFLVIGGAEKPFITKIRALLKPGELQEIRDKRCNFDRTNSAVAACGIKIAAPKLENAIAGMPIESAESMKEAEAIAKKMSKEIKKVIIESHGDGVIIKADSLGSLEALSGFLNKHNIPICKSGIGAINKKDVIDASHMKEKNLYYGIILGFNVKILEDAQLIAKKEGVNIVTSDIIYRLLDGYNEWKDFVMEEKKREALSSVVLPAKIQILGEFIFRKSKPAVIGVEILAGSLKPGVKLINEGGEVIGKVKQLQDQGVIVKKAKERDRVACSIEGATYEKDFVNHEILYVGVPERDFLKIKKEFKSFLTKNEVVTMREIVTIMRKQSATWGLG